MFVKYRKVASSRPVYYSIFGYFWSATNWDVLLTEMCYYSLLQQSIISAFQSLHFRWYVNVHTISSFTISCVLFLQFITKWNEIFIYVIIILGDPLGSPEFCIFISKDWEKSDRNFWGSYILMTLELTKCRILNNSDQIFLHLNIRKCKLDLIIYCCY